MKHPRRDLLGPWAVAITVLVGTACSPDEPPRTPPPLLDADGEVLVAVFLKEFGASGAKRDDNVCLRVRNAKGVVGDASEAVLAAIRKVYARAVVASGCSGGGPSPVTIKASGQAAWVSDIGPVMWDGTDAARVGGGGASRGDSLHIREVEYSLVRKDGVWRVTNERVTMQN
jgi:hypothetical protein